MEENNDIFLAVDYALVYLVIPLHKKYSTAFAWGHSFSMYVHKKYSTTFVWGHSFSMYVSYDRWWPPPFLQLRTYLMDGLFLN